MTDTYYLAICVLEAIKLNQINNTNCCFRVPYSKRDDPIKSIGLGSGPIESYYLVDS